MVTSVVSVLLPPSVAVTVTEYAFDDAVDSGVSKSGADLNVSSPVLLISKRSASFPVNSQLTVSPRSSSLTV